MFFEYRLFFYKNNVKFINEDLINYLTPRAVAY